jgi:hypothetical protein
MASLKNTARTQEMQALIQAYHSSGLTRKQFYIQAQIPRSTFQFWHIPTSSLIRSLFNQLP